ncbi:methionine aminopeptidase [Ammoniphilus sp. CFH 90114]|uniref:methionine aminopeptidase n=1 Tax=Ammoniphilus sp. CFH 90114 TaxID=2493665 RepID=UPI00100E2CE0|nr:methionine aminopeptidase [Ammoniphilus sp. CFH 90114]RXT15414.1 methionine aminopeptidase [Ammoniphilus sp. CFH 90114]
MGLIQAFIDWKNANHERKVSEMGAQGKCPDCFGRGFNPVMLSGFYYTSVLDCPGCNGSGLFTDWAESKE